jgi:hypothetical protein
MDAGPDVKNMTDTLMTTRRMRDSSHKVWVLLTAAVLIAACQEPHGGKASRRPELVNAGPGPADQVVRAALGQAQQQGRRLVVYVSATWCKPCERFQASLRSGELDAYFPDLRFFKFDHDQDAPRLAAAGYDGSYLPRFVVPDGDGRGTGQRMEGGTKADDTVFTSIGPRLQSMLAARPGGPAVAGH